MISHFTFRKSTDSLHRKNDFTALRFLAPSLCGVAVFYLIPFLEVLRRSVTDPLGHRFVGLSNYQSVLENEAFQLATKNTVHFLGVCIPLLVLLSLLLALMLHAVRPKGKLFQTTFLLPMAIPVASIVLLWKVLFSDNGLCNQLLLCLNAAPIRFMETNAAFWVLIATYLWKNSGYDTILWLTGISRIPQDQYEAAAVDGANAWQSFRFVTWPGIRPTLYLTALLSLVNSFKVFREAYLVAGQYPHTSIYLLQHLFYNWFLNLDLGRITAGAVLILGAGFVAAITFRVTARCIFRIHNRL